MFIELTSQAWNVCAKLTTARALCEPPDLAESDARGGAGASRSAAGFAVSTADERVDGTPLPRPSTALSGAATSSTALRRSVRGEDRLVLGPITK